MGSIGMPELMIILVIVMIIFGAGKLPQIGQNLGKAIRSFKDLIQEKAIDVAPKKSENTSKKK